jgi:tetratricopeptide (TPR) repeat protein
LAAGLGHHRAGRLAEAEACYRRMLAAHPDHADALHLLGIIAHQVRRADLAVDLIGRAIEQNERNPNYFLSRANALQELKRFDEAVASYDKTLALKADSAEAFNNRGAALKELKRFGEALASFDKAVALQPDDAEAFNNRGIALQELRRFDEALASYDRALALEPDHVDAVNNRGVVLAALRRYDEALASYDRALALKPDYANPFNGRGVALMALRRFEEALASYDRALALKPDYADAFSNRGNVLRVLKRFDEAVASYDKAVALKPEHAEAFNNRGVALQELRRFDEALASYQHAQALNPDYAEAHWNEGLLRLLTGDFDRGWIKSEWRWRFGSLASSKRSFAQPLWRGDEPVEGKTILLHSEQGLGDTIQFCRYAPLVAARGARVILQVDEPLRQIVSGVAGVSLCISKAEAPPDFDLHCPLLSLPLAFATRLESIPSATPYLGVPAHTTDWEARLGPKHRPRIGLVWSGNPRHENDFNRSIRLDAMSRLFDVAATFVSLQKDVRADDEAVLGARSDLLDLGRSLDSFSDTAALISRLDLVISVDTSVAHLAGALGRPVWMLLPYRPDWRWLLDREDCPWYPTARLFRQTDSREWQSVVERVHDALHRMV